ncbi:MAG: hypothetical protein Q8Q39_03130 [bacterium]|nr:hypothetical protein [bacterium]
MKYWSWRNFFVVLVLLGVLWYVFTHQTQVEGWIRQFLQQIF